VNKKTIGIMITVILVFSQIACALAGDSITFSVTATIPLIPGVNAPMIETEELRKVELPSQVASTPQEQPAQNQPMPAIQQEDTSTRSLTQGRIVPVLTKTFYSR